MFTGVDPLELAYHFDFMYLDDLQEYLDANSLNTDVVQVCRDYMVTWMNRMVASGELSGIHEHQALLSIQRIHDNHVFMQYFIRLLDWMSA